MGSLDKEKRLEDRLKDPKAPISIWAYMWFRKGLKGEEKPEKGLEGEKEEKKMFRRDKFGLQP